MSESSGKILSLPASERSPVQIFHWQSRLSLFASALAVLPDYMEFIQRPACQNALKLADTRVYHRDRHTYCRSRVHPHR